MMINQPSESFDYYPIIQRQPIITGGRPIFTVTIGQGQQKIIHPTHVEFTEDIICQKLSIRCLNANLNEFIFEIVSQTGETIGVKNGSTVTLRRVTYFRETHYRLLGHYTNADGDSSTMEIFHISISWPSRRNQPSVRADLVSLLAIQGDEDIHLPPRTFWGYWDRVGEGIAPELETYRENGSLPKLIPPSLLGGQSNIFPGFRSILECGTDAQVSIIVTQILGTDDVSPTKYRSLISAKKDRMGTDIDLAQLIYDMNIMYGYEYHVNHELIMYFRS
jgi:hypothetical protein